MANARSIHIGTNELDPAHYRGAFARLAACERDAEAMAGAAAAAGIQERTILTGRRATAENVVRALAEARDALAGGGLLVVTFSGHGTRLPNQPPYDTEIDGCDEAFCLYDRLMLDDEIRCRLAEFPAGVRILLLVDSCHSGSMAVARAGTRASGPGDPPPDLGGWGKRGTIRARALGDSAAVATYEAQREVYEAIRRTHSGVRSVQMRATVILISACKEWETAREDDDAGLFTATVVRLLASGEIDSHLRLVQAVYDRTSRYQRPDFLVLDRPDPDFERARPFVP
jgi:hypothetical protein